MVSRAYISTITLLTALIWGILLILNGVAVSITWFQPFSAVVGILIVLLSIFDLWLWRLPIFRGWFVKRPDLGGTWQATVKSDWLDPSTGKTMEPVHGYMVIRQTFSSLSLRLLTEESTSRLIGAEIVSLNDRTFDIVGVYISNPRFSVRQRSPIHNGAVLLHIPDFIATTLRGHYWTDRKTAGEIELVKRARKLYNDYDQAKKQ